MKDKSIKIISLAKKKLAKRNIEENLVLETIHEPDQIADGYGDRLVAQKVYQLSDKRYLLRVIYEEQDDQFLVITGYLTSQVSRYLEE